MNDVFLGIIAVSVLVMATIQVTVVIMALRATQRISTLMSQLEQDIRPLVANLQAITGDAARAAAVAAAQVERADKLFTDLATRLDHTLASVQSTVLGATRGSSAWLAGLKAALAALRDLRHVIEQAPRRRRGRRRTLHRLTAGSHPLSIRFVSPLDPTHFFSSPSPFPFLPFPLPLP